MNFRNLYARAKWALKSPSKKQRLLDDALAILDLFPGTHDLLQLAKDEGITIRIDPSLAGTESNGHLRRDPQSGKSFIELAPRETAEQVAATLIHELRHVWQAKAMGLDMNLRREEQSAEMTTLITRVREADAFAFTGVMLQEMSFACDVLGEATKYAKELMAKNGGKLLEAEDLLEVHKKVLLTPREPPPEPKSEMARMFKHALTALDSYDRKSLKRYHVCYTHPRIEPLEHVPANDSVKIADVRKMLKVGVSKYAPAYLEELDDTAFTATVMHDVAPKIRNALTLMDTFEAAASRGLSANDNRLYRDKIHACVRDAEKAPAPDGAKAMEGFVTYKPPKPSL